MSNNFNGQINISRDLRTNKNVIIGKYDITDISFLSLGIGVAFIVAFILGFSKLKIVDEFLAILISIIPMVFIISFGFKKIAGIRKFYYIRMKQIDKKTRFRYNRIYDKKQVGEKYVAGFEIDRRFENKYLHKFMNYENLSLLSVRYVKDYKTNVNKIYFLLDLRYKKNEDIFIDLMNKFGLNKELKGLSNEDLINFENDLNRRFIKEKKKNFDIKVLKKQIIKNLFLKHQKENEGNNENYDKYLDKKYKIYMLNLYDVKIYKKFINKVKRYSDVISYFKKEGKVKYVNTFLLIEDEVKKGKKLTKIEKVDKLCEEYAVILDKLVSEQLEAKNTISYFMTKTFNAYRVYK